ncbi:MAG: RNA polymerase sigma factor [Candidatus Omnitrophica bacterium]|nr:RNA polymerase sigma factor [Candidatus Omnitrophota bacterium]
MHINKEEAFKELIESFLGGNPDAFVKIATLAHADILNIVYRYLGNLEDAKDALQEVLIKIHRNLQSFRSASRFSTWMYRIAVNTALDALRKRKSQICLKDRYLKDTKELSSQKENIEPYREMMIKSAIAQLPRRQKNVFILKHYQGLTIEEISNVLGCSASSVKTHLSRAALALRNKMEGKV